MSVSAPFYPIFNALRKNGFPLGIAEYEALLEILQSVHLYEPAPAVLSKLSLLEICKTLWLKPNQVPLVFETVFNEAYDLSVRVMPQEQTTASDDTENATHNTKQGNEPGQLDDVHQEQTPHPPLQNEEKEKPFPGPLILQSNERLGFRIVLDAKGKEQPFATEEAAPLPRKFLFSDNYFTVTPRQVQQLFTRLPEKRQRKGFREPDIHATIDGITRHGYLFEVLYKKQIETMNELVLLHDHDGSMIAFEKLSDIISNVQKAVFPAKQARSNVPRIFYFRNAVSNTLFHNKSSTASITMQNFIDFYRDKKLLLVIVSDAGAARGGNSEARVKATIRMLIKLRELNAHTVWLNPMPIERWENTSAARIANFVAMHPVDAAGLQNAVESLKGMQNTR